MEKKPRILLVEDNDLIRQLYTDLLTQENYDVTTASDGTDAEAKINQGGWDLVLLDFFLPNKNADQILQEVPPQSWKKLVLLTNAESGTTAGIPAGTDILIKSNLAPDEFLAKVQSFLPAKPHENGV